MAEQHDKCADTEVEHKIFIAEQNVRDEEEEKFLLNKHKDDFRKVRRYKGHPQKYNCLHCKIDYTTGVGPMVAHSESHRAREITRVFSIDKGKNKQPLFRPEEHKLNKSTDDYSAGGAKLNRIIIPEEIIEDSNITCRKCKYYCIEYCEEVLSLHAMGVRSLKMKRHERFCNGKPPKKPKTGHRT